MADIVVPVHNALALTRMCVESILGDPEAVPFRLHLIDDASDSTTAAYLRSVAECDTRAHYLRNDDNLGFLKSANRGMQQGDAPFVVLVNSDVIVTPGWLARLIRCVQSDPRIASVNPLTNRASQIDLDMPPGLSFLAVDRLLRERGGGCADIVTGVGFCLLLRRAALDRVGLFDEAYGMGYCEESDLCMRLTTQGWRTVVALDCYVYHRGRGSFRDREERYLRNRMLFDQRWGREYQRAYAQFRRAAPLSGVRTLLSTRSDWDPMPAVWEHGRRVRSALKRRRRVDAARLAVHGLAAIARARRPRPCATLLASSAPPRSARARSVTYLLPSVVIAGGVLSVLQLVNEFVRRGVDARVAASFLDPAVRDWTPVLSEPMVFRSRTALLERFPPVDTVVATHWTTVADVNRLVRSGRARRAAYFVQDYEPWFFPEDEVEKRRIVEATYAAIPDLIVKSDWLAGLVGRSGSRVHKIPIGVDLDTYYPRDVSRHPRTILAMARPQTPRRGFPTLVAALRIVRAHMPDVRIVLFGDDNVGELQDLPVTNLGVIPDRDRLAEIYSAASVFIDSSDFQGFGRCALEAMACGAAAVVTDVGGVGEYAAHGATARCVAPRDPEAIAAQTLELLRNTSERDALAARGQQRARTFELRLEAERTLALLDELGGDP